MKPIPTNHFFSACAAVAALLPLSASAATFTLPTVGTYDETGQANVVDFFVTTQTTTPTAAGGAAGTLDGYKPAFATAFAANMGGVANFDVTDFTAVVGDTTAFTYGTSANKTLNTTFIIRNTEPGSATPISGVKGALFRSGGNDVSGGNIVFNSITNGLLDERVVRFGLTFLGRNNDGTISGVATYSDASKSATLSRVITFGNTQDTFFGFTAPTGLFIQSVAFTGTSIKIFDDLAFETAVIPEPSAALLGAVGMLALLTNRRRNG